MYQSIVSKQGQTTIPSKIRDAMQIEPGTKLNWGIARDYLGRKQIKVSYPTDESIRALRGIAKDLYKKYGGGDKYLEQERASWDD